MSCSSRKDEATVLINLSNGKYSSFSVLENQFINASEHNQISITAGS